jgi:tryptophan-rich hypothetical protein
MNRLSPKKIIHSKWTAVQPKNKEKHFILTKVEYDEDGLPISCIIEAVHSKRETEIVWQQLKDSDVWKQGWK